MHDFPLTSAEADAVQHLQPGAYVHINGEKFRVDATQHPEDDTWFIFFNDATLFLRDNRITFTKRRRSFPWISWPTRIRIFSVECL